MYTFISQRERKAPTKVVFALNGLQTPHRKKKDREFPVPSRDVTTKLSLGGNNDVITELFLPRVSLVSDIPAGDGKLVNLFYGAGYKGFQVDCHSFKLAKNTQTGCCTPAHCSVAVL